MEKTKMILVGGFLGAGKTSMMRSAAEVLKKQGNRVGLITNDQASNLVDTSYLAGEGNIVTEVSGSCFCCNFPGFAQAFEKTAQMINGGITIAEPVGSCTDLSATIVQPIKDKYADQVDLAPLTVMADPRRLKFILDQKKATANYIMTKQFDEADIILINKIDLLSADELKDLVSRTKENFTNAKVMTCSVKEGTGVKDWLDYIMSVQVTGQNLAEVDYDLYGAGEAAYGWMNATYQFASDGEDFADKADKLLNALASAFEEERVAVGHVKFLLNSKAHQWMGNITIDAATATLVDEDCSIEESSLTVNARAEIKPGQLQKIVLGIMDDLFDQYEITGTNVRCLIPGYPNPTYHYNKVVK